MVVLIGGMQQGDGHATEGAERERAVPPVGVITNNGARRVIVAVMALALAAAIVFGLPQATVRRPSLSEAALDEASQAVNALGHTSQDDPSSVDPRGEVRTPPPRPSRYARNATAGVHIAAERPRRRSTRALPPDPGCVAIEPPTVYFQQVQTYVGPVPVAHIHRAMLTLTDRVHGRRFRIGDGTHRDVKDALRSSLSIRWHDVADEMALEGGAPSRNGTLYQMHFFALDGTLMNMLRWGRIVNDNDVDIGFVILPAGDDRPSPSSVSKSSSSPASPSLVSSRSSSSTLSMGDQYVVAQRVLAEAGLVDPVTERAERTLYHANRVAKQGRCKLRPQFMQCKERHHGVIVDLFGPETVFRTSLTGLSLGPASGGITTPPGVQVFPLRMCKCDGGEFPCPSDAVAVLKSFTLAYYDATGAAPRGHREFAGCALLPRNTSEQSPAHVADILRAAHSLERCRYPSLLSDVVACAERFPSLRSVLL